MLMDEISGKFSCDVQLSPLLVEITARLTKIVLGEVEDDWCACYSVLYCYSRGNKRQVKQRS